MKMSANAIGGISGLEEVYAERRGRGSQWLCVPSDFVSGGRQMPVWSCGLLEE